MSESSLPSLPFDEVSLSKYAKRGLYYRAWFKKHRDEPAFREKINATKRRNYLKRRTIPFHVENDRRRHREYYRKRRATDPHFREKQKSYVYAWRKKHPDRYLQAIKRYISKHPEKYSIYTTRRVIKNLSPETQEIFSRVCFSDPTLYGLPKPPENLNTPDPKT